MVGRPLNEQDDGRLEEPQRRTSSLSLLDPPASGRHDGEGTTGRGHTGRRMWRQWNIGETVKDSPRAAAGYVAKTCAFYKANPRQLNTEILLGLAIAIMQVPESLAFAFTAGIAPMQGLQSTFFIGLFAASLGAVPGMVSGMAGAMAVVQRDIVFPTSGYLVDVCMADRLQIMYATMAVTALFQIALGVLQVPRLLRLLPYPVHIGFANGLSIVMGIAQLSAFQVTDESAAAAPGAGQDSAAGAKCPPTQVPTLGHQRWLRPNEIELWLVVILVAIAMLAMEIQPRIRGRLRIKRLVITSKIVPSSLTAMILTTVVEHAVYRTALGLRTKTVGDLASLRGVFAPIAFPTVDLSKYGTTVFTYAAILCMVGSLESQLTASLCAKLAGRELTAWSGLQEQVAQGLGNFVSSLFSTIGGSAMVGQSTLNIMSGARGRLSSVTASLVIALIIVVAGPAIELLPVASLTGILLVVVIRTIEWRTFVFILKRQMPWTDCVTIVTVTVLSVVFNLAIGVLVGIVWSALAFAWQASKELRVERMDSDWVALSAGGGTHESGSEDKSNALAIRLLASGLLYFGSSMAFEAAAKPREGDPPVAILNMATCRVCDASGVHALVAASSQWHAPRRRGKQPSAGDETDSMRETAVSDRQGPSSAQGRLLLVNLDAVSQATIKAAGPTHAVLIGDDTHALQLGGEKPGAAAAAAAGNSRTPGSPQPTRARAQSYPLGALPGPGARHCDLSPLSATASCADVAGAVAIELDELHEPEPTANTAVDAWDPVRHSSQ